MSLRVEDEGLHPASDDADWQESAYLAWWDAPAGLGGNHRIGNESNRGTANLWCGVYREDGTRFRHNDEGFALVRLDEHGLAAGPQRLFHDGRTLRFVLDGDGCEIDLEIDDESDSVVVSRPDGFAGTKGQAGTVFSSNFHAFCRLRGTVTLEGKTSDIDAPGWRDHSWGVRRWDSFLASRSFGGAIDSLRFHYGSMVGANGSFFRRGSLTRDGKRLAVDSAEMVVHLDDDSLRCPAAEVQYRLDDGRTTTVRIETVGGMLGVTGARCGWESVGNVWLDGEPGGWGFLEVNNNPRDGRQLPVFALDHGLTNGITHAGEHM